MKSTIEAPWSILECEFDVQKMENARTTSKFGFFFIFVCGKNYVLQCKLQIL